MKQTEKFVFFYGGFMSQWIESPFIDYESMLVFNTAEQWMMYKKAKYFNDVHTASLIMETPHPAEQKRLGRRVKGFNDKKWDKVKYNVVYNGNLMKFTQNEWCWSQLIMTNKLILVEASPTDKVWGIGMSQDAEGIEDRNNWQGENLLGKAIMEVRDVLMRCQATLKRLSHEKQNGISFLGINLREK